MRRPPSPSILLDEHELAAAATASSVHDNEGELRLRIVRTATASLREADREDARRNIGKRRRRNTLRDKLRGRRSLFRSSKAVTTAEAVHVAATGRADDEERPPIRRTRTELGAEEQRAKAEGFVGGSGHAECLSKSTAAAKVAEARRRRYVWLNWEPPEPSNGASGIIWARNKVKTSKYSLLTFVPKNLAEQFRRAANLYFLVLVVLQIFPMFGAAAPQVAMLPLLAVLSITAFKDALEDWRRHRLDNEVNQSAVTRLGNWQNVNVPQPRDPWWRRVLHVRRPSVHQTKTRVSKGVRKLREKEGVYSTEFLYSSTRALTKPEADVSAVSLALTDGVESLNYNDSVTDVSYSLDMSRTRSGSDVAPPSFRSKEAPAGVLDYNRRPASNSTAWERTLWKKLEVGDVILLREDEQVPADIVLLSTSDPDGVCFVETKNLDGETNLKPRRALRATANIRSEEDVDHARFVVDSEPPHANLYSYNAVLRYPHSGSPKVVDPATMGDGMGREAITINELLLRGCALRNTAWAIGLVVFTGADTKIMLNQGETPSKRSKIEKETNFNVLANFAILIALCLTCAIANGIYLSETNTSADAYEPDAKISNSDVLDAIITFAACLILFQNIVPISLVITVELVKSIQALFLYFDIDMYYEPLDHPCVPKSWNISDDLGQIAYIFSDKTGTLTQNIMEFQRCSVGGIAYGEGVTESMIGAAKRSRKDGPEGETLQSQAAIDLAKATMIESLNRLFKNRYLDENQLTLISPLLASDFADFRSSQRKQLIEFFRSLALCHTVLSERQEKDGRARIDYKAESPDEAALVSGARDIGFTFLSRTAQVVDIEVMGQPERWIPLRVLEFNSTRKRMSVIVRAPDGRIHLICKGADSVIYQRLRPDHDEEAKARLTKDLEDFANAGLRTLCIATRTMGEAEFEDWAKTYDAACSAIDDREEEIEKACEIVERGLTLQGATALEDKLQSGVPDAIEQLHLAGIKLWVLTGDKLQTAIEIGFAANVLQPNMDVLLLSSESLKGALSQIEQGLEKISSARANGNSSQQFAVVIDGETLRHALDPTVKASFLDLTVQCETVICCRVSPAQKAQTVRLIKEGKDAMTLAIGDGANDVAMIQAAHVGVGIAGMEGAQAAMSADYAIGQFRFLTKLLLVHGRWSYIRVAGMHANFFFKSVVWTFASFLVQPWANFDALYLFDVTLILAFNLLFTSLPVLVLGAFEQDVPAASCLAYPALYKRGILGLEYTKTIFWTFIADGVYQGAVVYFVPFFVYAYITSNSTNGYDYALPEFGTTVAICAVLSANLYVGLNICYWSWLTFVAIFGSCAALFIWIIIISNISGEPLFNLLPEMFGTATFWFLMAITQVIAIGPRFVYKYYKASYAPSDVQIVRERALLLGEGGRIRLENDDRAPHATPPGLAPFSPPLMLPTIDVELASIDEAEAVTAPASPSMSPHSFHSLTL